MSAAADTFRAASKVDPAGNGHEPDDLGAGLRTAEVVDRRTHHAFAAWYLPPALAADPASIAALEARVIAAIAIGDRRILKTYGLDLDPIAPSVRMELSREPRLVASPHAAEPRGANLAATVAWLHEIAEALDKVATSRGLAHGAVSPFWVRQAANGSMRLDG